MKQARARIFALTVSLALSICVGGVAFAAIGDDPRLGQLENKFYKHTFPKDDDATRLDRLEKMIFGEAKSGSDTDRLKALADTVPNLGAVAQDSDSDTGSDTGAPGKPSGRKPVASNNSALDLSEERTPATRRAGESQYPAVTAMEEKLFNKTYVSEAVNDRLNRLETKVFGRPSKFTDLSERVDALKEKTTVDVAKSRPAGSDWIDDDDEDAYPQPNRGTDIAEGTGYGGGSGSYGMAPTAQSQAPRTAPPRQRQRQAAPAGDAADDRQAPPPTSPVALSAQVTALEQAVLGEPGTGPLVDRVGKLEKAVFADKASANAGLPMPERIAKLVEKVPIASAQTAKNRLAQGRRRSAQSMSMDDDDLDNMDSVNIGAGMGSSMSSGGGMTMQGSKPPGGLSKIINGIGNMLGNGYSTGYYLPSTSYRDAATGYPVDGMGNIINPTTGAIVGRSTNYGGMSGSVSSFGGLGAGYVNPMMPTYGIGGMGGMGGLGGMGMGMPYGGFGSNYYNTPVYGNPYGGYSGFNNGFAPYGSRGGINFGGMGGGMRIGF